MPYLFCSVIQTSESKTALMKKKYKKKTPKIYVFKKEKKNILAIVPKTYMLHDKCYAIIA